MKRVPINSEDEKMEKKTKVNDEEMDGEEDTEDMEDEEEDDADVEVNIGGDSEDKEEDSMKSKKGCATSKGCAKKSEEITEYDLEKSLARLEEIALDSDPDSRKNYLLQKAQESELTGKEKSELFDFLGGKSSKSNLKDKVSKGLKENDNLQKSLDVSDFLSEQHGELVKSLEILSDNVENSSARQNTFNLILARAVADIGKLSKAMGERLSVIENEPAHAPKSKLNVIQKSFTPSGEEKSVLSKGEILSRLDRIVENSFAKGENGITAEGIDLGLEMSKFEQTSQINPKVLEMVKNLNGESIH